MSQEKDKVFFRNFSLVVGALVVMMIIFIIMARILGVDDSAELENQSASVAERTAPIGAVSVAGEEEQAAPPAVEAAAASDGDAGKKIYDGLCAACHGSGIPGIPQLGDKAAWAPRLAQDNDTLYAHAIDGFTGSSGMMMPPRGGGTSSDDEVKAAVDYMISKSVAEGTAPIGAVSMAGEEEQAAPPAVEAAAASDGDAGKKIYDGLCAACHGSGIPGIPQLGDKAAWAPRIEQGMETLYAHSINGLTGSSGMMMPPRGGGTSSDDEVKAAVDYMVSNSQ